MNAFDSITARAGKIVEFVGVDPHDMSSVVLLLGVATILMSITLGCIIPALVKRSEANAGANKGRGDTR